MAYYRLMAKEETSFQSISPISGKSSLSIQDDLLQTNRMTIIDVVEATNVRL